MSRALLTPGLTLVGQACQLCSAR